MMKKNSNVTNGIPKWIYLGSFSKSDNGKVFKNRGNGFGGRGDEGEGGDEGELGVIAHDPHDR